MGFQEQIGQQIVHAIPPVVDLVVAVRHPRAALHPVQHALASQRRTHICLAHHRRQQRIVAQLIVIIEILVAQRQPEDPLRQHVRQPMLGHRRIAAIVEALAQPRDQLHPGIGLGQQHHSGVGGDRASVDSATTVRSPPGRANSYRFWPHSVLTKAVLLFAKTSFLANV